jgi:dCMP deaminase
MTQDPWTSPHALARPEFEVYFMGIALAARERANCIGQKVGAVLVVDDRVVSTGYNGTPQGMANCETGGCERCANRDRYGTGQAYDRCICVHAEQNAILSAARFGIRIEGGVLYSTTKPCFNCLKETAQVALRRIYYIHEWSPTEADFVKQYQILSARIPGGLTRLDVPDPRAEWALGRKPAAPAP